MAKKLIIATIVFGGIVFFILFLYFLNLSLGRKEVVSSANLIQDHLSEAVATKMIGDQLNAKKKNLPADYTWENVKSRSFTLASLMPSLDIFDRLKDYQKSAVIWTVKIREAAKNNKTWPDLPDQPADFKVQLREKEAGELFKNSLVKIGEIRQFGDYAVANKDKEAMRYVVAKLMVQSHWLQGISRYEKPSIFAWFAAPAYAYAVEGKQICFTTWNGKSLCSLEVIEMNTEMYNAASGVYENKDNAADNWYKVSEEIHAQLEAGGIPIETLGGVVNVKDKIVNKEPVLLTNFKDACLERGGMIGGANQIVDRLPTTERGTFCSYKNQVDNCWNYMTNSGGFYAGGDVGCVQIGLTPMEVGFYLGGIMPPPAQNQPEVQPVKPAPVKATPVKTKPQIAPLSPSAPEPTEVIPTPPTPSIPSVSPEAGVSQDNSHPFDGSYYVSETYTCNLADGTSRSFSTSYSITVKDGVATTNLDWGKNSAAISGNSAQVSGQPSDSYYRYNYTINMNFSQSPNGTWVSGTRNWSQTWIGYSEGLSGNCHGSFSGSGN